MENVTTSRRISAASPRERPSFAAPFGAGELARYLGLWHDIGKYGRGFQDYLLECEAYPDRRHHGPDHKGAGATLAARQGDLLALVSRVTTEG